MYALLVRAYIPTSQCMKRNDTCCNLTEIDSTYNNKYIIIKRERESTCTKTLKTELTQSIHVLDT